MLVLKLLCKSLLCSMFFGPSSTCWHDRKQMKFTLYYKFVPFSPVSVLFSEDNGFLNLTITYNNVSDYVQIEDN